MVVHSISLPFLLEQPLSFLALLFALLPDIT